MPFGYSGQSLNQFIIDGYEYIPIKSNCGSNVWVYVPIKKICDAVSLCDIPQVFYPNASIPNVSIPNVSISNTSTFNPNIRSNNIIKSNSYERQISFYYEPLILTDDSKMNYHYYMVNSTYIDPLTDVTKLPININSSDSQDITSEIFPIGNGLAFALPFDSNTYQINFSVELRINTEKITLNPPNAYQAISYLADSDNPNQQHAVAQLVIYELNDKNDVSIDINPAASIKIKLSDMLKDKNTPNSLEIFEDQVNGEHVSYYKSQTVNSNTSYNIVPNLDSDKKPITRRLVTIVTTEGFSFDHAIMNITEL